MRPRITKPPRARSSSVWDNVAGTGQKKRQGKPIVKQWKRQSRVQCMFPDIFWLTLHMLNKCHLSWDLGFVSISEKCSGKLNDKNPIAFALLHCVGKSLNAYSTITFAPRKKDIVVGKGKNCLMFLITWNTIRNYDFGFIYLLVSSSHNLGGSSL